MNNSKVIPIEEIPSTNSIGGFSIYTNADGIMAAFEIKQSTSTEVFVAFQGIVKKKRFEWVNDVELFEIKKDLLKKAFKNRTKQLRFAQLNSRLLDCEITEHEYENEINENANKYEITIPKTTPMQIKELDILADLVSELKKDESLDGDVSVDEVSELFEVNLSDAVNMISLENNG